MGYRSLFGSKSKSRDIWDSALRLLLIAAVLLLVAAPSRAQEAVVRSDENESLVKDLGRKSKVILNKLGEDAASNGLILETGLGVFDAFFASLSMIVVSEIGDETFIIAALMAMRHPKSIVLSGALSALVVMTVLSTGLGRIVPNLISRKHTNSAATVLYAFFGMRLLYIAWRSDPKSSQKKEMEEVEEKLETGQGKSTLRRFFSRFLTPIFLESFILTFLAEWGDRSQIATIALATHKNAVGVAVGATVGHTICTSLAVVGGSMLASKISQRTVAMKIQKTMRDKMERLILLPFATGCMSESSVAVASPTQNEPRSKHDPAQLAMMVREMQKQGVGESEDCSSDESMTNSFGFIPVPKPNISAGIHRLYKGLKSFSHLFVYKEDVDEEEMQIEIGAPTDVKHVTHVGWDGCGTMKDIFGRPLSHLPLASHEVKTLST